MISQLTPKHVKNIRKLIKGLKALPDDYVKFNMNDFVSIDTDDNGEYKVATLKKGEHMCGTSACVVGHGPSFGIKMDTDFIDTVNKSIDWTSYSEDVFGVVNIKHDYSDGTEWDFCFGGSWPNSISQAVIRLELLLSDRIPKDWKYRYRFNKKGNLKPTAK